MPEIYLPYVRKDSDSSSQQRLVIDPVTRIEGHLRLEVIVENGVVVDAYSAGTMFRGIELILNGRDPRDAWIFTQRICGVCTTVHALASVRAVENALGLSIPDNARLMRNIMEGALFVYDHVMHFYHLHALDWVDIVSALSADVDQTSALAQSISTWPNSSPSYFQGVKDRLTTFAGGGQIGLFANGYWGHPAYKLPPEANLLLVSHYLEALDWQRNYVVIHATLGGKNPHPQTYLVGGMAAPMDDSAVYSITHSDVNKMKNLSTTAKNFVTKVYMPDLLLVASYYPEWAAMGGGHGNFLSFGDFPLDNTGDPSSDWLPSGVVMDRNIGQAPATVDQNLIEEYIARSWYSYSDGNDHSKHPSVGETTPHYTGPQPPYDYLDLSHEYSWLKAPRYADGVMEVGPLARVVVAYAAGHARIRTLVNGALNQLNLGTEALFSVLGRVAARGIETQAIAEQMVPWLNLLDANLTAQNYEVHNPAKWDPATWPSQASGWGVTEAPRGALGHWVQITNGAISHYQTVVPTTWNGSPRDVAGQRGAWEEALIGTPVADLSRPVEILRLVHSFDPCMSCAVHLLDVNGREMSQVSIEPPNGSISPLYHIRAAR